MTGAMKEPLSARGKHIIAIKGLMVDQSMVSPMPANGPIKLALISVMTSTGNGSAHSALFFHSKCDTVYHGTPRYLRC